MHESSHQLAAIMFTDIVGYTALMGSDEDRAFEVLRKNKEIHETIIQQFNGKLIKEIGDGMLISFPLASDAVKCAVEIQITCKKQDIALRIGIHEGEMVFAGEDVYGDGVNIASRLQEEAKKGCIAISEKVYSDIKNKSGIHTKLIGDTILKNIDAPVKVYEVLCEEMPTKEQPIENNKVMGKSGYIVLVAMSFIVIATILGWYYFPDKPAAELDKSIAVLPFDNLGPPEHAYFTDGMTEEITSRLATIKTLSVTSRKSAIHYAKTDKTIKQIGKELGVNYILEGTIRWSTTPEGIERVRITAQLILVAEDTHVWTDSYDRQIDDIFKIQSEIAQKVGEQLGIALLEGEQSTREIQPTANLDAYQAYLRGIYYINQPHFSLENWNRAIESFQQAVEIDTMFALAYAELARSHARFYNLRYDLSESRLKKSDQAAVKALELGQDQPEVHLAIGYYYLWAYRNRKKALEHLVIAEKGLPNNVEIMLKKAAIFEPQGRWEEYINSLERAIELSPRDASIPVNLAMGLWYTRRYSDAIAACNQAITLTPDGSWPYLYKTYTYWSWQGANAQARDALEFVGVEHEFYLWSWYWQEVGEGNYEEALQLLSDTTISWVSHKLYTRPKPMLSAFIYEYLNKNDLAYEGYKSAKTLLEKMVMEHPDDPRYHSSLGIAYAGIGQKKEAIREGKKAVKLLPMSKDAAYGIPYVHDLAVIYTMTSEYDLALNQIEYLLSVPSWLSVAWIEMDICFAPLRTLPRYRELLTKYAED
jgi:TolB-like protein/class 3 adenylate cyclase/Flp pilus assembly protein TadD